IISMSGAADHGSYRKQLLLAFAFLGSLGTMMFITVTPNTYLFSALWATIGNVCLSLPLSSSSNVCLGWIWCLICSLERLSSCPRSTAPNHTLQRRSHIPNLHTRRRVRRRYGSNGAR